MSIVKVVRKENPFVQIDKSISEDSSISWAAKGIMLYLLSKPGNWSVNVADIVKHSPVSKDGQKKRGNGEDAVYARLKELKEQGYAQQSFKRDEKGLICGSEWIVFEEKQPRRDKPDTDKPDAAKPDRGNPDFNNKEFTNNDSNNTFFVSEETTKCLFPLEAESEAQALPPHSAPPPPPAKKGKSTCTNEPKPILYKTKEGFAKMPKGYTTEFAKIFDQVLSENSKANNLNLPQYNWKAKAGADMKDIKRIAEMVADAMIKKKSKDNNQFENNEITEDEISHGVHFFMQSGFNWLLEIASNKDGKMANFSPSTLARNFNSIIQFAHKPKVQVTQKSKIQAHHDTTLADLDEQRRTRFERHFGEGTKPATSPIDFLGGIRTIKI